MCFSEDMTQKCFTEFVVALRQQKENLIAFDAIQALHRPLPLPWTMLSLITSW